MASESVETVWLIIVKHQHCTNTQQELYETLGDFSFRLNLSFKLKFYTQTRLKT